MIQTNSWTDEETAALKKLREQGLDWGQVPPAMSADGYLERTPAAYQSRLNLVSKPPSDETGELSTKELLKLSSTLLSMSIDQRKLVKTFLDLSLAK